MRCVARNLVPRRPAPVALAAAEPALTSFRGPTARRRASGSSSRRCIRQGFSPGRHPLSVSPHWLTAAVGNHLEPPSRPARPAPLRGKAGLSSAHARAPRSRRPAPAPEREKGNRRRLAVSARAHLRAVRGTKEGTQGLLLVDNASTGRPGASTRQDFPITYACVPAVEFTHPIDVSFALAHFFFSSGAVAFYSPRHPPGLDVFTLGLVSSVTLSKAGGYTLKNVNLLP